MAHNYIGTEHLLLGMMQQEKDPATELLHGLNMTRDETSAWLEDEIVKHLIAARAAAK
jgi:ATP-dependent Clp protease ATP-binding subunit ClpA